MSTDLSAWWDAVELWVVELWFPVQFLVVMAVVAPLCVAVAWSVDKSVDHLLGRVRRGRG